jgi:hypothetical protein
MKFHKQSFNVEALVNSDISKKEFMDLVDERACKMKAEDVWKEYIKARKKFKK